MPQTSIAGGPSGKATREMNFNKQDSRSVLQVLSDQQLIEKLKRINSEDSSDNDDGDVSIGARKFLAIFILILIKNSENFQ